MLPQGGPNPEIINVTYFYVISLFLMLWAGSFLLLFLVWVCFKVLFIVLVVLLLEKNKRSPAVIKMANHSPPPLLPIFFLAFRSSAAARSRGCCHIPHHHGWAASEGSGAQVPPSVLTAPHPGVGKAVPLHTWELCHLPLETEFLKVESEPDFIFVVLMLNAC